MKILLTGANGLLGQKIVQQTILISGLQLIATSKGLNRNLIQKGYEYESLDITSLAEVMAIFEKHKPEVIINTAAMTNVDECEKEQEKCWEANVIAVQHLIEAAKKFNIHLVHLSTDFVFDGAAGPYAETDQPAPLSYYGLSKFKAEELIQQAGLTHWAIARTIIVYGVGHELSRGNIVLWVKQMLEQGKEISIVDDQFRSPTLAEDLADGCIKIAQQKANGIFHLSGEETLSIYALACRVANYWKLNSSLIKVVKTGEFTQAAKRPLRTGFNINKAKTELGYAPRNLENAFTIINKQL